MTDEVRVGDPLDLSDHVLELEDRFTGPTLDAGTWLPYHLPHWSSRAQAAARYDLGPDGLVLRVDEDQPPWCPRYDGATRVSSLQTALRAGPVGSPVGQHRIWPDAVVQEAQPTAQLYTPHGGAVEVRLRATPDPDAMVALWMIGTEDVPEHSAEVCVAEIFGRDVAGDRAVVGMGVHPFGDPTITDDVARVPLDLDATQPHTYAAAWSAGRVAFAVDGVVVRVVDQAPDYPLQLMLGLYAFAPSDAPPGTATSGDAADRAPATYPKRATVAWLRGYAPPGGRPGGGRP